MIQDIEDAKLNKESRKNNSNKISLNAAYRINLISSTFNVFKIDFENRLEKSVDVFEIIWPHMRYLFSSNLLKDSELIKFSKSMQYKFWKYLGVEFYLKQYKKYLFSADMLEHALNLMPDNISISGEHYIVEKIKCDKQFSNKIYKIVAENNSKNKFNVTDSIVFNEGDLLNSIQKAQINVVGIKRGNTWTLNINIFDVYDFTEFILKDFFQTNVIE